MLSMCVPFNLVWYVLFYYCFMHLVVGLWYSSFPFTCQICPAFCYTWQAGCHEVRMLCSKGWKSMIKFLLPPHYCLKLPQQLRTGAWIGRVVPQSGAASPSLPPHPFLLTDGKWTSEQKGGRGRALLRSRAGQGYPLGPSYTSFVVVSSKSHTDRSHGLRRQTPGKTKQNRQINNDFS